MFKLWSEVNKEAKEFLKPDLGYRDWGVLNRADKEKIWRYLDRYYFVRQETRELYIGYERETIFNYSFPADNYREQNVREKAVEKTAFYLNENFKAHSFAKKYLVTPSLSSACFDFYNIFMEQNEAVTMEMLSCFSKMIFLGSKNIDSVDKDTNETEGDYLIRKEKAENKYFDDYSERLNDVFLQFGIKYYLTRDGFVPRQEKAVMEEVYEPVLKCLSNEKWKKVNDLLSDAFTDFRKNTPQGYSGSVTNTISAVEAFMQILVEGKTGGKKLSPLITEAQKAALIPNDVFSSMIFKNIDSIFARERKATGDAHPKEGYATEKNAKMLLNLAMVFLQHCVQG